MMIFENIHANKREFKARTPNYNIHMKVVIRIARKVKQIDSTRKVKRLLPTSYNYPPFAQLDSKIIKFLLRNSTSK